MFFGFPSLGPIGPYFGPYFSFVGCPIFPLWAALCLACGDREYAYWIDLGVGIHVKVVVPEKG